MEQLHNELRADGYAVQFAVINHPDDEVVQHMLADRCTFPLFQDTRWQQIWALHDGWQDDMYIYDRAGELAVYLPVGGEVSTILSTPEGYQNLKDAVLGVLAGGR